MPKEFLIFEKGKYPQGDYSNIDVLTEFVNRFNETKIRLSCFIGHKYPYQYLTEADELAHGEVTELRINQRGQIFAVDYEFDDELKEKIAKRQLLWVSPEIIGDGQKQIDITGLAFLGRTPPQNPFTIVPSLFGNKECNFIKAHKFERDFYKSFSLINKENQPMTDDEKKMFSQMQEMLTKTIEALNLANQKIDMLEKQQVNFQNQNKFEEAAVFFGKLKEDGIIMPADLSECIAFDSKLNDEDRKIFRAIASKGKKILDLSGQHFATNVGQSQTQDSDVYDQIKVFQIENKIGSFEEAAKSFYAKNPKAFSEGA